MFEYGGPMHEHPPYCRRVRADVPGPLLFARVCTSRNLDRGILSKVVPIYEVSIGERKLIVVGNSLSSKNPGIDCAKPTHIWMV